MLGEFRAAKWSISACIRLQPTPWFCAVGSTEIGPMPANRRALIGEVAADDPASILGYDAIKTRIGEQHRQQAGRNFNGRKARWKIVTLGEGLECPIENDATRGGVCGCCRTN